MSSPLARSDRHALKDAVVRLHQKASHHHRIDTLANLLAQTIDRSHPGNARLKCLDIGCGDMTLAESIGERLPRSDWSCIDIHPLAAEFTDDPRWAKYQQFDGCTIDAPDRHFDASLFCDVMHHIPGDLIANLKEAARVSHTVVIKDHFEYSLYSRTMLKLMDIVGNWGYDISIPKRYFSRTRFAQLAKTCGLEIADLNIGLELYRHNAVFHRVLRPKWQFIAVLRHTDADSRT